MCVPLVVTVTSTWRRSCLPPQRYVPQCLPAELLALVSILVQTHIHLYHHGILHHSVPLPVCLRNYVFDIPTHHPFAPCRLVTLTDMLLVPLCHWPLCRLGLFHLRNNHYREAGDAGWNGDDVACSRSSSLIALTSYL